MADEIAWVVIDGSGAGSLQYWTGRSESRSTSHADALRFARRIDAEQFIALMREQRGSHGLVLPYDIRAEEHIWDAEREPK
jgi:hypothetical protein